MARLTVVIQLRIHNGRVQLRDAAQASPLAPVDLVQRLAKDELAAVWVISEIKPVINLAVARRRVAQHRAGGSRVHTSDHDIGSVDSLVRSQVDRHGIPVKAPEDVEPIYHHHHFMQARF